MTLPALDLLTSSVLGTLVGVRHALEPDHVAAVTTLVGSERSTVRAALLGAWWGLGHTLTLVTAGAVLLALGAEMPPALADLFEGVVALVLVGLGARAVAQAVQQGRIGPPLLHRHWRRRHIHPAGVPHMHIGNWTLARRPLIIGALHGLAGSGALTALVLATIPSSGARLVFVALFGLGSTVSMAAISGALGLPLARLGGHHAVARGVILTVGCLSVGIGLRLAYPILGRLL